MEHLLRQRSKFRKNSALQTLTPYVFIFVLHMVIYLLGKMLFYPLVTLDTNDGKMWPALDYFTSDVLHKYAAHSHRQIGGFYNLICIYTKEE